MKNLICFARSILALILCLPLLNDIHAEPFQAGPEAQAEDLAAALGVSDEELIGAWLDEVLLDNNLTLGTISMFREPAPIDAATIQGISTDPFNAKASQSRQDELLGCLRPTDLPDVTGAVADGETRIRLFLPVPGPGEVAFLLFDASAPEDGGVGEPGSDDRLDFVLVPVTEADGQLAGIGQYLVPEDFNRGGDDQLSERTVLMLAAYLPDGPFDPFLGIAELRLMRPPVVLLHGLWSNPPTAWNGSPIEQSFLTFHRGDYEDTNARSFAFNLHVLDVPILELCEQLREQAIAMAQVDVIGHSMGGILARNYESVQSGLINRLITLNTPHAGSLWANVILGLLNDPNPFVRLAIRAIFRAIQKPVTEGAIADLAVDSEAINAMQTTIVPSHALAGIGGRLFTGGPVLERSMVGDIIRILRFFRIEVQDVFNALEHDLVVGRDSQIGGNGAFTTFDGLDSLHWQVTRSENYSNRVICPGGSSCPGGAGLLNAAIDGPLFGSFPAPVSTQAVMAPAVMQMPLIPFLDEDEVELAELGIVSPADGSVVTGGETITVVIEAPPGFDMTHAILATEAHVHEIEGPPFTAEFPVPPEFVGALEMTAFGADSLGDFAASKPIILQVQAPAELLSIEVTPRNPILFSFESQRRIYVSGQYADGVIRNLTDPSTGTQYLSADPGIATVSNDGVITPISAGITTMVASNETHQDTITVTVRERDPAPPDAAFVTAEPDQLWPPNGKMVPVRLSVMAADNGALVPGCAISNVSSNEAPIDGDFRLTGELTLELRAKRLGSGDGRIYTIEATCTGGGGGFVGSAEVRVPHDMSS